MRRGLAALIEPEVDLTVVGGTGSAPKAQRQIPELDPDLVILDLSLEEGSGLTLLEHLHATQPDLPILIVSMHDESIYARRALEAGARGYLMKNEADSNVVEAIRDILEGGVYLSPEMTAAILSEQVGGSSQQDTPLERLSDRELEVFMLLGKGHERREMAEALTLSPKTIDTYRDHLKEKLSIDTNAGLRRYAAIWMEWSDAPAG